MSRRERQKLGYLIGFIFIAVLALYLLTQNAYHDGIGQNEPPPGNYLSRPVFESLKKDK